MPTRNELTAKDVEALRETLARRAEALATIPTLPQVAVEILSLVGDANAGLNDFGKVVKTDQGLTGKLLKLANSAYFAQAKPVTNIQRALVLLGIERLKAIVLGFQLTGAVGAESEAARRRWNISLYRAWLAHRVAERIDTTRAGEAFVVGLLLDIGEWYMDELTGGAYAALQIEDQSPAKRFAAELSGLEFTHVDLGGAIARNWRLPRALALPIEEHHTPQAPVSEGGDLLRAVAYAAGQVALEPQVSDELTSGQARVFERVLGLDAETVADCATGAALDFEATASMFEQVLSQELTVSEIRNRAHEALSEVAQNLVVGELENPDASSSQSFTVGGLIYCVQTSPDPNCVRVFIEDASGSRLMSEQIDTGALSAAQLRERLMADRASDAEFAELYEGIQGLAA